MQRISNIIHWGVIVVLAMLILSMLKGLFSTKYANADHGTLMLMLIPLVILFAVLVALKFMHKPYIAYGAYAFLLGLFLYFNYSKEIYRIPAFQWWDNTSDPANQYFKDEPRRKIAKAIVRCDLERLQFLLQNPPHNINEADAESHINLLDFARDRFDKYTHTPIHWRPVFELLLQAGATIRSDTPGRVDTHVREIATMEPDMLHYFLDKGANPNAKNAEGQPIVLGIIQYGDDKFEKVQMLLNHGLTLRKSIGNMDHFRNVSPLIGAAAKQEWDICKLLVEAGDNVDYVSAEGISLQKVMKEYEKGQKKCNDPLDEQYLEFKKILAAR